MNYSHAFCALFRSMRMNFISAAAVLLVLLLPQSICMHAQTIADSNIRISQIYTRGGEAGSTFLNDYIELFNRGNVDVDINGSSLSISNFAGTPPNFQISSTLMQFNNPNGMIIGAGKHFLI